MEHATQATTRENLSSGFPTKRVSNQSLRLNRLDRKLIFSHEASLGMILLKKKNTVADETAWMARLVRAFIVTNHRRQVFSVAVQLLYVSFNHGTYKNLIIVKYDNSDRIVICAVSSKHFQ